MYTINFDLDTSSWSGKTVPSELLKFPNKLSFTLIDLLLHVADSTKNPNLLNLSINDFWAFLRYRNCFNTSGNIALNQLFEDVDPHQKTILSDDIGMGFASLIMDRTFGLKVLTDTGFFIKHISSLTSKNSKKRGPNKTPDFIALDNNLKLHIVECKGTQTSLAASDSQILNGIAQKNNMSDPSKIIDQKLVIGTFIARYNSVDTSRIKIIDPDFDYNFSETNSEELICLSLFAQLNKELSFYSSKSYLDLSLDFNTNESNDFFNSLERIINDLDSNIPYYFDEVNDTNNFDKSNNIYVKSKQYIDFYLEKSFDFSLLKSALSHSNSIKEFLLKFKDNKKTIIEGEYQGIFGLNMKLRLLE